MSPETDLSRFATPDAVANAISPGAGRRTDRPDTERVKVHVTTGDGQEFTINRVIGRSGAWGQPPLGGDRADKNEA